MDIKQYIITLFLLVFTSSCATQDNYLIKNINFEDYKPIKIDASELIIEQLYISNIEYPYIDHLVKQDLVAIINNWSAARLSAIENNNSGILQLVINIASIKAFKINKEIKIEDFLSSKAAMNIEMNLDITINLLDKSGNKISYLDLKVFKSQELGNNISLLEKDYLIQEMSESLIKDFDRLAVNKIKEIFYKNLLSN